MDTIDIDDGELPATARRLWLAAQQHQWHVWATKVVFTRAKGAEERPVTSVVLRLSRGHDDGTTRLAASWEDGRFDMGLRQSPFGKVGAREVLAVVTS